MKRVAIPCGGSRWVNHNGQAGKALEVLGEPILGVKANLIAQMIAHLIRDFIRVDKQIGLAFAVNYQGGERERCAVHITAAYI